MNTMERFAAFEQAMHDNAFVTIQTLLKEGMTPNITNEKAETPLLLAAKSHQLKLMELLLEHGAKVVLENEDLQNALVFAVRQNARGLLKLLFDGGIDVNRRFPNGSNLLMVAAEFSSFKTIKLLLAYGAKLDMCNNRRETALSFVVDFREVKVVRLCLDQVAKLAPNHEKIASILWELARRRYSLVLDRFLLFRFRWEMLNQQLNQISSPNTDNLIGMQKRVETLRVFTQYLGEEYLQKRFLSLGELEEKHNICITPPCEPFSEAFFYGMLKMPPEIRNDIIAKLFEVALPAVLKQVLFEKETKELTDYFFSSMKHHQQQSESCNILKPF